MPEGSSSRSRSARRPVSPQGTKVEIRSRDGTIEIEAVPAARRLVERAGRVVIEAQGDVPPLTDDDVRAVLERTRR